MPRISARVCWSRWRPTSPSVGAHLADHLADSLRMCNSDSASQKNSQPLRQPTGCHLADRLATMGGRGGGDMMTMLTTMTMMGRARDDGDNAGGGRFSGTTSRTHVRTNEEGALADRLSRSRIAYVRKYVRACARVRVSWLRNRLRLSTSPNATRINPFTIHDKLCCKVANWTVLQSSLMEPLMRGAGYSQSSGGGSNLTSVMPLSAGRRLLRSSSLCSDFAIWQYDVASSLAAHHCLTPLTTPQ